jgi:hypothetical protein
VRRSLLIALVFATPLLAHSQALQQAAERGRGTIPFPLSVLMPSSISDGIDLRSYIASPEFGAFSRSSSPEISFDEIYHTAVDYAHGDVESALLAATIGTMEHEHLPFSIFGLHVDVPLTSESHARFQERVSHLPDSIYHTHEGDRDKLQHFFASAWLKQVVGMNAVVRFAAWLVEKGESLLLSEGDDDPRDLRADYDGIRFGVRSTADHSRPPSRDLTPNP